MKNNSYLCNDKPKTNDFPMPMKKNNYWWTKLQRTLDHEMSLSYWRLLGWLTLVFLAVLLLVVLLLGAIALLYPKFNLGDINIFEAAFLLDSIGEFISDKGSRSVFGEMDARELKAEYARCELGDGFYYDIERDSLKKLKIVKY